MNRSKLILLSLLFVVGFSAPSAMAAWSSHGDNEPNTEFDTPDLMWADAPKVGDGDKIYFNSHVGSGWTDQHINSATLGSRVYPVGTMYFEAVFGIWKDCNGDNYIGSAESGLQQYRSELLLSSAICPAGADRHNDGNWVYELVMIGFRDPCIEKPEAERKDPDNPCTNTIFQARHPNVIYLENSTTLETADVNLWADWGYPGEPVSGGSCPIRPLPSGSTSNTGLMLRFGDCIFSYVIAKTITAKDPTPGKLLAFDGCETQSSDPDYCAKNPNESDSVLNQNTPVSLFGNPQDNDRTGLLEQESGQPTFTVFDCQGGATVAADPTSSSLFEAVDGALDAKTGDCDPTTRETALATNYYDLNLYGQKEGSPGLIEGAHEPTDAGKGKIENSWTYYFDDDRGRLIGLPETQDVDQAYEDTRTAAMNAIRGILGGTTPESGGPAARQSVGEPVWQADVFYLTDGQLISRKTFTPEGRVYLSNYAAVNADALKLAIPNLVTASPLQSFTYAAEACPATGDPVPGWNCDATAWYPLDKKGNPSRSMFNEWTLRGAVPGDKYSFRDVDCFDGTVAKGFPVKVSLVDVSADGICDQSTPLI